MKLKLGDHLVTYRMGYTHHGIYSGRGTVIHYSGLADGLEAGSVKKCSLESFAAGQEVSVRVYDDAIYKGREAVARARSRLGEDRYDLHANNCEHFCTWVVTGRRDSAQIAFAELMMGPIEKLALGLRKHSFDQGGKPSAARKVAEEALFQVAMHSSPIGTIHSAIRLWKFVRG